MDAEDYGLAAYRYIEANPVRAAIAAGAGDYPWSSHRANAPGDHDRLVTQHDCYRSLGRSARGRQAAYRTMFEDDLPDETIDIPRDATQGGWVPGRKTFHDQIAAALRRSVTPPVRGRPRKPARDASAQPPEQGRLL